MYERKYVWSVLLRLYHWAFALSIVVLIVTGSYIHDPWTNTMLEGSVSFPMANFRYWHFIAGFVFTGAVAARLFLLIFGNKQERFWDMLPITPAGIKNLFTTVVYYGYVKDKIKHKLGHSTLAGTVYIITLTIALFQLASGFYMLYPEHMLFQTWGDKLFNSQQQGRFLHYLSIWWFIIFPVLHIYLCIWHDLKSKGGLISSIVNGVKYEPK